MPNKLLTVQEAARVLKVSEKTLRRWEAKNYINPIRTSGKHRRYSLELLKSAKRKVASLKRESYFVSLPATPSVETLHVYQSTVEVDQPKAKFHFKSQFKKVFAAYFIFALLSVGGYGFLKFKSASSDISVLSNASLSGEIEKLASDDTQQVLAATSFQNAEFNINIPAVLNSSVTMNSDVTIGADTFNDITGEGLAIVGASLTTTLGNDITSTEIVDGTISEADLLSSNVPTASQYLTFNTTTGGFTWITPPADVVGTNFFSDGGDTTYLTDTDEDFAIGGTDTGAPFFFDSSSGNLSVDDITINSIALDAVGTTNTTSGASLVGVFDEFANSSSTNLQDVLDDFDAAIGGGSGMTSFTLSGDTGTDQTVSDTDILVVAGGTNGIDTVVGATDTVTLNLDTTEIGTTTFGSGSGITWTFDVGATDPSIAFASGSISIGGGQVSINTTNGNITTAGDVAVNGGDITSSGDLTITPTGGDIFFSDAATLNIGGNATDVAYNVIGDSTSGASANVDSDDDLYIEGNIEVDGSIFGGGIDITSFACPDCVDYDDMADSMTLDADLAIAQTAFTWTQSFTGTTTTGLTYNANSLTTGSAINITTSSNPASSGPVSVNQINATSTNSTTPTTLAVLDIGFVSNSSVAGNTEYVLQIQNDATANTTDNAVAALLRLDNADTSGSGSTVVTNGLLITNSGGIAGGIVNAINIDDTSVTTDIVLQNDETIDNNVDGTILLTANNTSLTGDLIVQGGDITLNTAGTIIPSASGTITIGNSNLSSLTVTTTATGDTAVALPTGSISGTEILDSTISEVDLNVTNSPTSAYILSYDAGGGFTWISNTGGTGASKFTDSGSLTYLTDSTDSLTIGSSSELGKLAVDGDADETQLLVQGNATQTSNLFVVEDSAGNDFFVVEDLGGVSFAPSSTDDITITTDSDSTIVVTGLTSAAGSALCLDGSNNVVICTVGSGSSTLQSSYVADTDGSDAIITLSSDDDSIIFRNPSATAGTDSDFTFRIDNIDTGLTTANFKNFYVTEAGSFDTTSTSLTNYASYITNTSTESAGSNTLTNVGLYVTSTGADTNYSGIFESGNFGIGDTTPASLFTVGATDAFQVDSSGNIVAIGGAAHSISNSSGDLSFTSANDYLFAPTDGHEIDITAVASTATEGVVDINADSSVTGGFEIMNSSLTVNNGASAGDDFTGNLIALTANDADADLFGIQVISLATANATAGSYEALIRLDNAENTIGAVTDGILITSSSSTDTDITDGIDVSHANITNAINVGANVITGTTADINLSNFDVTGSTGNITTAGDIAINGGDITTSGDLTISPAGGDLFLSNGTTLNIGGNATDVDYNIIGDSTSGASASMTSDDDLYVEGFLEADGGLILTASSGTGSALCLDGSGNVVTCTTGTGGIAGSGTAGQVAFFDTATSISSETDGFGWDSTNRLFTIIGGSGNTTQTTQAISSAAQGLTSGGLLSANLTNTSATASFTGDILGVTSTRDNDLSQTLTDTGNLVEFGRTTTTNAAGATTNVTGAVLNVTNTVTATSGTINDSANLVSITQDADATGALVYLNTNRSSTGTALLIEQSSGGTDILQIQDNGNITMLGDLAITGGNITTAVTADSTLTITGTLTSNGNTVIGNANSDTLTINAGSSGTGISFIDSSFATCTALETASGVLTCGTDADTGATLTLQQAYSNDVDGSDVLIALDATDGNLIINPIAGTNFQVAQVTSAPTTDIVSVTNVGLGTTTDGVDGLSVNFVTGDGTNPTNNGINVALTSGGTSATDVLNGMNLSLTGTSGTERGINFADNNFDTDINATTDLTLGIGGTNEIILTGTNLSASTAEGNSLGSATLEWEQLFLGDDNGIAFGLDQDWTLGYDETTDDRLELVTSGTSGMLVQTATATGTAFNLVGNSISTGTILQAESTSTALTTAGDAFLGYFDWTPGSATSATGDLVRINIGANGNVTNVFNVTDNGTSLFRVSETQIESAVPHAFTAAGDISIVYDLIFTNQTASTIDSYGPLAIKSGESFESNNLTLTTYNSGNILLNTGATAGKVGIGAGITPSALLHVSNTGTGTIGQSLVILDQDETQHILTASASGVTKFVLDESGKVYLGALDTETANTTGTCWFDNTINGVTLKEITDCNGTPTDLAENFGTSDTSIEAGDVVITDGQAEVVSPRGLLTSKAYVKKSDSSYNSKILGVISTAPNQVYGEDGLFDSSENPKPVSLAGRVPTKVNLENGPIVSGDPITSSSTPGVAMKATRAGQIIGMALEDFNPSNTSEVGKIIVFMNVGYQNPTPENAVTREEIEALLLITEQNQALLEESQNWNTNTATQSAEFSEVVTNDLFVTGVAAFDTLSLTNSLTLNNNLVIGDGNIDSLTTPLNIQGSGAQALNFMAGKVAIDTSGNMIIQGDLKVLGALDAGKVNVSNQVAGVATIIAGTNEITILNENIKVGSLVFVTPTTPVKNTIYVKSQVEGQAIIGFDPTIVDEVPELTTEDIKFNWWIVGVTE